MRGWDAGGVERYRLQIPRGLHLVTSIAEGPGTSVLLRGGGSTLILRSLTPTTTGSTEVGNPTQSCTEAVAALGRTADPQGGPVPMAATWSAEGILMLGSVGQLSGVCAPAAGLVLAYLQPVRYTTEYRSERLGALARSVRLAPHFNQRPAPVPTTTTILPPGMTGMPGSGVSSPFPTPAPPFAAQ